MLPVHTHRHTRFHGIKKRINREDTYQTSSTHSHHQDAVTAFLQQKEDTCLRLGTRKEMADVYKDDARPPRLSSHSPFSSWTAVFAFVPYQCSSDLRERHHRTEPVFSRAARQHLWNTCTFISIITWQITAGNSWIFLTLVQLKKIQIVHLSFI